MLDKDNGKKIFGKMYDSITERCDVAYWNSHWGGIDETLAWQDAILNEIDKEYVDCSDLIALMLEIDTDLDVRELFCDGFVYALTEMMNDRYCDEHPDEME